MNKKVLYSIIGVVVLTIVFVIAISSNNSQSSAQTINDAPIQNVATSTTAKTVSASNKSVSSTSNKAVTTSSGTSATQPQYGVRTKTSGCVGNQALPDPACSPGAVLTTDTNVICVSGYTQTVRNVPDSDF